MKLSLEGLTLVLPLISNTRFPLFGALFAVEMAMTKEIRIKLRRRWMRMTWLANDIDVALTRIIKELFKELIIAFHD